ncbi:hypothetical protein TNCV_3294021 [Trichonephila clavipes]|nr:hypothetical protein TNCV_3294021 [Trichonephila clavipes]
MFDSSSHDIPTPLTHADASRDVFPRGDDSLRWRAVGKLEEGWSQADVAQWLQVAPSGITAPHFARDLSAVSGRISRQLIYSRLAKTGLCARRPVWCLPLTVQLERPDIVNLKTSGMDTKGWERVLS